MEKPKRAENVQAEKYNARVPSTVYAPWYDVPNKHVVSIEHPCIIRNVDKGVETMGGLQKLQELVQDSSNTIANLYLRPGDRTSKPLKSANVRTNNILLKVTVPRKTGLKRKKGAQGPYYEGLDEQDVLPSGRPHNMVKDAEYLIRTLRDRPNDYQIQPVGSIDHTHRFRGMPDFVYSTANSPFMRMMKDNILPFEYEKIKGFKFDMSKGVKPNTEIIPPPSFTHLTYPFNYSYRQNPSVKQVTDELGNATMVNISPAQKAWNQPVPYDVEVVPGGPSPDIPSIESQDPAMQRLIEKARKLLEERPIFTRRALMNSLPGNDLKKIGHNAAKYVYQYVGYLWASGPWRDAVVRFGVDPRKDPECRKYQTMMFMLDKEPRDNRAKYSRSKGGYARTEQVMRRESHLFDGRHVSMDGKVWQVCDITDPLLSDLLATKNVRKECHIESDGWYHNGTFAKVKLIMKTKINAILDGIPANDTALEKVAREMPDIIRNADKALAKLGDDATPEEIKFATTIRTTSLMRRRPRSETTSTKNRGYNDDDDYGDGEPDGIAEESPREPAAEDENDEQDGIDTIDESSLAGSTTADETEPDDEIETDIPAMHGTMHTDPRLREVASELGRRDADADHGANIELENIVTDMEICR